MNEVQKNEALEQRDGLPDALRVLLENYPRDAWESDANFTQLIRFWLDRHLMFRRLLSLMQREAEQAIDQDIAPGSYAGHLSRYGAMLLNDLHAHHTIEDTYYFPHLKWLEKGISRGFDILDRDHQAIDGHLQVFADEANLVLRAIQSDEQIEKPLDLLHTRLKRLDGFLNRHLTDEEELVVPVLLKHVPEGLV